MTGGQWPGCVSGPVFVVVAAVDGSTELLRKWVSPGRKWKSNKGSEREEWTFTNQQKNDKTS
ncbi:hypothetical protein JZ751_014817 [Albula glossodonta]|uniref:Uncharacterized protein n=1 Tax=Albula glossodonta TaxID=121402 RepID=A0A8T2N4G0_9TELE|nr:hypothetical protein JZ751_014817 [Albula glossodonta]